jgi:hypothetical protein
MCKDPIEPGRDHGVVEVEVEVAVSRTKVLRRGCAQAAATKDVSTDWVALRRTLVPVMGVGEHSEAHVAVAKEQRFRSASDRVRPLPGNRLNESFLSRSFP